MYQVSENDIMDTLNDFKAFCGFIDDTNPKLSARTVTLGKNAAFEVNAKLKHQRKVTDPKYTQEHYPIVDLLFKLSTQSKLYVKMGGQKLQVYLQPTERKGEFDKLNPFEQYAFLLEVFWSRFELGTEFSYSSLPTDSVMKTFSSSKPGYALQKGAFSNRPDYDPLFANQANIIRYFSFLGFCTYTLIDHKKRVSRYKDVIHEVIPTALGVSLSGILKDEKILYWNVPFKKSLGFYEKDLIPGIPKYFPIEGENEEQLEQLYEHRVKEGYLPLATYLAGAFPAGTLKQTIPPESNATGEQGNYFFKVSFGSKIWRIIKLSSEHTLEDLHLTIQKAYQFDNDHLYSFYMDGKEYSDDAYNSPWSESGPYTDKGIINELGLYVGQKILYHFDFGDDWLFDIQLTRIEETDKPDPDIEIVESKGEAPDQYQDDYDF